MISRAEALVRAREWASAGHGDEPVDVDLFEFDLGYVAWVVEPPRADPSRPPETTGSPRIVIDGETGAVSQWPSLSARTIAARYADTVAARDRFPADVRQVLDKAGWFPGRDVSAAVDLWRERYADVLAGLEYSAAARTLLTEFGGLDLPQFGPGGKLGGGFESWLYPYDRTPTVDQVHGFAEDTGLRVFPVGMNDDGPANLALDSDGRMFLLHWAGTFLIGTGDEAVTNLVRGGPFVALDDRGDVSR